MFDLSTVRLGQLKTAVGTGLCVGLSGAAALPVLAAESTPVTYSDFSSVITNLTNQISVSTIVGVLASAMGICVGLVFMWWGLRKVVKMIMAAARGGRASV